MTKREMRLHEWYECALCKEFHPLTLNEMVKSTVHTHIMQKNSLLHHTIPQFLEPVLQSRTPHQYVDTCQKVNVQLNELEKLHSSTLVSEDFRQMVWYVMRQLDGCFHVAKCIAEMKQICVEELKKRFIFESKQP